MRTTHDARRKPPAERRSELLDFAVQISSKEGLGAVTLRKVASAADVTPGLVSHYFSSAEQLTNATFRRAAQSDLDEARRRVAHQSTATAKITTLIDYVLDDCSLDAAAVWLDVASLGRRESSLAAEATTINTHWLELLTGIVEAGIASGEFDSSEPPATARRLLTIIDGFSGAAVTGTLPIDELQGMAQAFTAAELKLTTAL